MMGGAQHADATTEKATIRARREEVRSTIDQLIQSAPVDATGLNLLIEVAQDWLTMTEPQPAAIDPTAAGNTPQDGTIQS